MLVEKFWEEGLPIASFVATTNGPEQKWDIEMRLCLENGKQFIVITDPFADRFMWFDNDLAGKFEARRAFEHLVGLALCDADVHEPDGKEHV